jgi:betaine reductase
MDYAVMKAAGYVLVHTPDMILHNGTTQTTERAANPESEYLKKLPEHLRTFEQVVNYAPNQTYIGNLTPEALGMLEKPWVGVDVPGSNRFGKFGEIMPQVEFIAMLKLADVFDLVKLEKSFSDMAKAQYSKHRFAKEEDLKRIGDGDSIELIEELVKVHHAEAIYNDGKLVGCVKKAHDVDVNLTSHVMFENLVVKASGILAFQHLIANNNINPLDIDYVIECSEEACGDMNQRGGGNFAKSIAEMGGAMNATGSDLRGFCAAPTHALITAASLVKAGTYKNVVIVAGGATAKLGMNGKDHVKKGLPILEDVLGGFAILVSENDGVSPILRTDLVGKHNVGTGSSPQAVITALVTMPLDKGNLKITDIDKYSVEMQNPDITKPAGAGDVPEANYKMIAAIGVKRGELERAQLGEFVEKHGMQGWAPTQGHIPSGVPYAGYAIDDLTTGTFNRAMIVGKGSLFLGRMTNLFDGVSIVVERNSGVASNEGTSVSKEEINSMIAEAMRGFAAHLLNA